MLAQQETDQVPYAAYVLRHAACSCCVILELGKGGDAADGDLRPSSKNVHGLDSTACQFA